MDIDQATKGYLTKRVDLQRSWDNPSLLGDNLLKLATYLTYMGDELGRLKESYENERATCYFKHLNRGQSATSAENLARSENAGTRGQIAKLELAHKNGWSLVSIGQSRLRGLESEARNQT